ncbi:hypothetical protein JXQ31_04680 [candidate division KSB1 bacterium]|nr:hypothetical protein [candidate division KSB1 bacterium]
MIKIIFIFKKPVKFKLRAGMFSRFSLHIYALCLGIASITIQIILMREFMAVFYGNELCIGILLSVWLFWVASGSWLGTVLIRKSCFQKITIFSFLQFLLFLTSILAVIAIKYVRVLFDIPYGEYVSFIELTLFAFLVLLGPCLLIGFQFSFLAGRAGAGHHLRGDPASRIYIFEAFGSAFAGFVVSLAAFSFLSNMEVLLLLVAMLLFFLFLVEKALWKIFIAVVLLLVLFSPLSKKIQTVLLRQYWQSFDKQMQLIDWRQSKFGELALVDWGGEKSLYVNGVKQTIVPDPVGSQELASLVMTQHPGPRDILLLGGGLGGLAGELAKYENSDIVYVELDREACELCLSHQDSVYLNLFRKSNLKMVFTDGRYFLSASQKKFDIIIVNVGRPATASNNRYFTGEFFRLAKSKLKRGGIFTVCGFPSAENYFGPELLQLNAGLYSQLRQQFNDVVVIPGDAAIYFASIENNGLTTNTQLLAERFISSGVQCDYFYSHMFWQYYFPERLNFIQETLESADVNRVNRDFAPVSYYYDFVLWNKLVRGHSGLFVQISRLDYKFTLIFPIIILICFVIFSFILHDKKTVFLFFIPGLTAYFGFASITMNVLLLLFFQIIFGYIYEWIGLALSVFMTGMALMSLIINHKLEKISNRFVLVLFLTLLILLLLFLTPLLQFVLVSRSFLLFFILLFCAGALTGGIFPLVCVSYCRIKGRHRAGTVYAADLIGGACGSIVISGFFIPLYGFTKTLLFAAVFGLVFLIYLCGFGRKFSYTAPAVHKPETG